MSFCRARWVTCATNGVQDEYFSVPTGYIVGKNIFDAVQSVTISVGDTLAPGNNNAHVIS